MPTSRLPAIDFSKLPRPETRQAIDAACRDWGMFYIVGHGIAHGVIANLQEQMRSFFAQPLATKREVVRTAGNPGRALQWWLEQFEHEGSRLALLERHRGR